MSAPTTVHQVPCHFTRPALESLEGEASLRKFQFPARPIGRHTSTDTPLATAPDRRANVFVLVRFQRLLDLRLVRGRCSSNISISNTDARAFRSRSRDLVISAVSAAVAATTRFHTTPYIFCGSRPFSSVSSGLPLCTMMRTVGPQVIY